VDTPASATTVILNDTGGARLERVNEWVLKAPKYGISGEDLDQPAVAYIACAVLFILEEFARIDPALRVDRHFGKPRAAVTTADAFRRCGGACAVSTTVLVRDGVEGLGCPMEGIIQIKQLPGRQLIPAGIHAPAHGVLWDYAMLTDRTASHECKQLVNIG
jgi:hypothetical protein